MHAIFRRSSLYIFSSENLRTTCQISCTPRNAHEISPILALHLTSLSIPIKKNVSEIPSVLCIRNVHEISSVLCTGNVQEIVPYTVTVSENIKKIFCRREMYMKFENFQGLEIQYKFQ